LAKKIDDFSKIVFLGKHIYVFVTRSSSQKKMVQKNHFQKEWLFQNWSILEEKDFLLFPTLLGPQF